MTQRPAKPRRKPIRWHEHPLDTGLVAAPTSGLLLRVWPRDGDDTWWYVGVYRIGHGKADPIVEGTRCSLAAAKRWARYYLNGLAPP